MYTKKCINYGKTDMKKKQRELQYTGIKSILRKQILSISKIYLNWAHVPKSNQTITIRPAYSSPKGPKIATTIKNFNNTPYVQSINLPKLKTVYTNLIGRKDGIGQKERIIDPKLADTLILSYEPGMPSLKVLALIRKSLRQTLPS